MDYPNPLPAALGTRAGWANQSGNHNESHDPVLDDAVLSGHHPTTTPDRQEWTHIYRKKMQHTRRRATHRSKIRPTDAKHVVLGFGVGNCSLVPIRWWYIRKFPVGSIPITKNWWLNITTTSGAFEPHNPPYVIMGAISVLWIALEPLCLWVPNWYFVFR